MRSGGKKGKGGKKDADPELDALMAELDAPKPAAAPAAGGKKKKKGGKGALRGFVVCASRIWGDCFFWG